MKTVRLTLPAKVTDTTAIAALLEKDDSVESLADLYNSHGRGKRQSPKAAAINDDSDRYFIQTNCFKTDASLLRERSTRSRTK